MTKFTIVQTDENSGYCDRATSPLQIQDENGYVIAIIIGDIPKIDYVKNANLFSAAPDLLNALKDCVESLKVHNPYWSTDRYNIIGFAEKIISEVEGKNDLS